tara:strand:+ start:1425 stop:2162 length:738 start_codon:yes stop_codon:yes gene_type:complete
MVRPRIIPVILIKDGYAVKTTNFNQPQYIGEPINIVRIFNDKQADEITIFDIGCSKDGDEINFNLIKKLAIETKMPLCYGGGIKSVDDAYKIFSYGVEKISLNNLFFSDKEVIFKLIDIFGSQSISVTVDVNQISNKYSILNREDLNFLEIFKLINKIGIGELTINCVHKDGTRSGFDTELLGLALEYTEIPVTIVGGASSLQELEVLSKKYQSIGLGVGSLFVYKGKKNAVLISYSENLTNKNS